MSSGRSRSDAASSVEDASPFGIEDLSSSDAPAPWIPTSWGEILDRISILEIKTERLEAIRSHAHVRFELQALRAIRDRDLAPDERIAVLNAELETINRCLWDLEDQLRAFEAAQRFDAEFVESARRVYLTNDRRAAVKSQINALTGSTFFGEKVYGR